MAFGIAWYLIATQLVIPHFNDGSQAFYLQYFYGDWGGSLGGIAENVLRHPDRVIDLAMKPDRIEFYYKLGVAAGWVRDLVAAASVDGRAADAGQRDRRRSRTPGRSCTSTRRS